jgi:hypothetical protein
MKRVKTPTQTRDDSRDDFRALGVELRRALNGFLKRQLKPAVREDVLSWRDEIEQANRRFERVVERARSLKDQIALYQSAYDLLSGWRRAGRAQGRSRAREQDYQQRKRNTEAARIKALAKKLPRKTQMLELTRRHAEEYLNACANRPVTVHALFKQLRPRIVADCKDHALICPSDTTIQTYLKELHLP